MRLFVTIGLLVMLAGLIFAWKPIRAIYFEGVPPELETRFLEVPTGSDFEDLVRILKSGNFINDEAGFRWVAKQMSYANTIRSGRFEIQPGWNNRELIQHLRSGKQAPVVVVLNSERLLEDVAGKVSRFIEPDSMQMLLAFRDQAFLSEIGFTEATLMSIFIPNSYEFFWNTDPKTFIRRMIKESDAFWAKNNRLTKAQALGRKKTEVYTLASIVERETNANSEKPTIAGVYLNRLRIGMPLQADPTCVFATRDFTTHRVTQYHTKFDSPYNTYIYKGLPPGPISMASISSIDAVLNPQQHNYLYFCAKPDDSGTHAFAATLPAHNVNVDRFRNYLRTRDK
jgi:UPF0755 protein